MQFNLVAPYKPTGDQPQAIQALTERIQSGKQFQTLKGITGSGKTFTIANVIANVQKPTLVISHNKTLTAQLFQEFREFFPHNAVHYFVSYYDYYQPEAYIPQKDLYIEKDASINEEIDRLRLATTAALMSRKDVIVVASVSGIYNIGSPLAYRNKVRILQIGEQMPVYAISKMLTDLLYERNDFELSRAKFRVRGNNVDVYLAYTNVVLRIQTDGNRITGFALLDPIDFTQIKDIDSQVEIIVEKQGRTITKVAIYPAKHHVIPQNLIENAINRILSDMQKQVDRFKKQGKLVEAQRLEQRVLYDVKMIQEVGYCKGIENYSIYFDGRQPGEPPYTLLDYFPEDYLLIVDESHMTIPQFRAMYRGDYSRKKTLVDYGFRLPAAFDNRPLKFEEFEARMGATVFMSATPGEYEIKKSGPGGVIEQLIRPTGIPDPEVFVRPAQTQVQDLIQEIEKVVKQKDRVLVLTLTKKMAEHLADYLQEKGIKVRYLHSDIKALERSDILTELRRGEFDVLVGINLLREGIDLPEVRLVAILDADKEGFLRSTTSLIQIMGRAARHVHGYVILYADKVTESMKQAIAETKRRRKIQLEYNKKHGIKPKSIQKKIRARLVTPKQTEKSSGILPADMDIDAEKAMSALVELEPVIAAFRVADKSKQRQLLKTLRAKMKEYAQTLQFEKAIVVRDLIRKLQSKKI